MNAALLFAVLSCKPVEMRYHSAPILPDNPELTPDLDWMLQSGQIPVEVLAAELVTAHLQDLVRWTALVFDDQDLAVYLSLEACLAAALNAYRMPGEVSSQVWVFQKALRLAQRALRQQRVQRLWQGVLSLVGNPSTTGSLPSTRLEAASWLAIDRLADSDRLAATLAWGLDTPPETIAAILGCTLPEVAGSLKLARRKVLDNLATFDLNRSDLPEQDLDTTLSESLSSRFTLLQPESLDLSVLAAEAAEQARRQSGRQSIGVRLKEFAWLGVAAALILGLFWMVNRLLPEEEPAAPPVQMSQATVQVTTQPTLNYQPPAGVVLMDYFAQPGETVDQIGDLLQLTPAEVGRLRSVYSDGNLDFARPVVIELTASQDLPLPTSIAPHAYPQAALTIDSSPGEIRHLMNESRSSWQSLWLDSVYFNYGLQGFTGRPETTRVQAWLSQPDLRLTITWNSAEDNTYTELDRDGLVYTLSPAGKFQARHADALGLRSTPLALEMITSGNSEIFNQPGQMQVLGEDTVAGRQTLVVDWSTNGRGVWPDQYRIWIDSQTGIVMRYQFYANPISDALLGEVIIVRLDLDVNFPQPDLFSPWRLPDRVFVSDYRSSQIDASVLIMPTVTPSDGSRNQARQRPPPGFDPAASRLKFQYTPEGLPRNQTSTVGVFADEYYLGDVHLTDPWSIFCTRSPDGSKVAYSFNPYGGPLIGSGWFALQAPLQVMTGTIGQRYGEFAFSQDSRQLAFWGRERDTTPGILSVIDTETGETRNVSTFVNATSLVWSPDGRQIALVRGTYDWFNTSVIVVDAVTGEQLYSVDVKPGSVWDPDERGPDWPAPDWPARDWGVAFPHLQQGLSACIEPPP